MSSNLSRREFLRWAAVAGAGAIVTACGPKATLTAAPEAAATQVPATEVPATPVPPEQATVVWWNPDVLEWQPAYQGIADLCMANNPGIKVEIGNVPESGFSEKITASLAGGTAPDVWTWFYAVDYYRHGIIQELDAFIEAEGIKPETLWFEICNLRGSYQGKRYGTPRDAFFTGVIYNKDLFDEFGVEYPTDDWDVDGFLDRAKRIQSEEKGTWGTTIGGPGDLSFDVGFCWTMGFEIVSEDGRQVKGLLDSDNSIWAIQWMLDLQVEHKVAPPAAMSQSLGDYPFASGKVGTAAGTGWIELLKSLPFKFDQLGAPVKPGIQQYAWGDSVQYHMWSESKNKEAAWKTMYTASSPEGGTIAMQNDTWVAPCPEVWLALGRDKDPITRPLWLESQKRTKIPNYLRTEYEWDCVYPNFEGIWTRYIENNERPLETLVQEAAETAQKCLDERYAENP